MTRESALKTGETEPTGLDQDRPHLLLVGGWTEIFHRALDGGFRVSYLGPTAASSAFDPAILRRCEYVEEVEIDRIGICVALARRIHSLKPLTAVVSFTELGLETAAVIADALGVRGLELWPVSVTRYKDWMRRVLADRPHLTVAWRRVSSPTDVERFYSEHGPAIIVKPVNGAASVGVTQIKSVEQMREALKRPGWLRDGAYLAEKLVDGSELYSCETLTLGGRHTIVTFSSTQLVGYPYALATYTMVPPPPGFERIRDDIVKTVREFLNAIGLTWGVTHTELKVDSDGRPVIIESQTRVGGDRIWRMAELTTGVSQVAAVLRGLVDDSVSVPHLPPSTSVGVFFCLLAPAGRVRRTAALAELAAIEGVLDSRVDITPGQELGPITDNTQRRGYVLLHAPDHDAMYRTMRRICHAFWVEYDDGHIWHPEF
jgi:biotin carboxylase